MATLPLEKELLETLHNLTSSQQQQVLSYARSLPAIKGTKGSDLVQFSGQIDKQDLQFMEQIIQADCETIEANEW
jgi:hypothetical protein